MNADKQICSGCGKAFQSTRPSKYYQFCSVDCREIVEDQAEELVDETHYMRSEASVINWMINIIYKTNKK